MRKIIIIIGLIGIVSCTRGGHKFNPDEMRAVPDAAIVYFYRPSKFKAISSSFPVTVNKIEIGTIDNGAYFKHVISPGDYKIHSATGAIDRISTFTFEAGKTYFVRCFIDEGLWVNSIRFVVVHEKEALPDIQKTSLQ